MQSKCHSISLVILSSSQSLNENFFVPHIFFYHSTVKLIIIKDVISISVENNLDFLDYFFGSFLSSIILPFRLMVVKKRQPSLKLTMVGRRSCSKQFENLLGRCTWREDGSVGLRLTSSRYFALNFWPEGWYNHWVWPTNLLVPNEYCVVRLQI